MHEMDADSALSHCRRHALNICGPRVAYGKHTRLAGLQHFGRAVERPPRVTLDGLSVAGISSPDQPTTAATISGRRLGIASRPVRGKLDGHDKRARGALVALGIAAVAYLF